MFQRQLVHGPSGFEEEAAEVKSWLNEVPELPELWYETAPIQKLFGTQG